MFKESAKANLIVHFGLLLVVIPVAIISSVLQHKGTLALSSFAGIAIMIVGSGLPIKAKWPQIKSGKIAIWGLVKNFESNRKLYVLAYTCLALGFAIILMS